MNTKAVIYHITDWLKSYAKSAKIEGFVVGVSGGIDSAVTSTLCAKTGLKVYCLEMPIHQDVKHISRAQEHLNNLETNYNNVTTARVDLSPVFEALKAEMTAEGSADQIEMALANTRARLRMTTLYYYAGLKGFLVVGTGNKVEDFGVGFYTKYGDGGVDLSPIADLLKSEVYELGQALNVPESIMQAPPSDGLWGDARSDEAQIGASYPELEWAMANKDKGKVASDFSGREREVFKIFTKHNTTNSHKMNPIPVCEVSDTIKR